MDSDRDFQDAGISSKDGKKSRRGRPTIASNFLLGLRNAWIYLLEQNWPEIGWRLLCIRNQRTATIEDIQEAMMPLMGKPNGGLAAPYYRESSESADAREIRGNRKKLSKLAQQILAMQAKRVTQEQLCCEVELALKQPEDMLKDADPKVKETIQLEVTRRRESLVRIADNLGKLESERDALSRKLLDQESYFYRAELLDFLHSPRYAVKPRPLANALAGLPQMRWRQSHSRCSKMPNDSESHLWYRTCETIRKIWRHRHQEFDEAPVEFFRAALLILPKKVGDVRQSLLENWRDLRLAIEECWNLKRPAESVPFVITAKFVQNRSRPKSTVEQVLADQEKLSSP